MEWFENITQFNFPTVIRFGKGAIKELGPHLKELGHIKPMLVTDPGLAKLALVDRIMEELKQAGHEVTLFHEIDKNPVKSNVDAGTKLFRDNSCNAVIGLGGGASMDVARAIALMANQKGDLFDYEEAVGGDQKVTEPVPYFVTVPTTSGTGSEVGRSSVISDDKTHQKKIFFHPSLLASRVFADPELTLELPSQITAATGMDALTHNIEAYLAKGFHPMCDGIALEGIRLCADALPMAVNAPNLESRTKMMAAAMMGAVAFQKGLGMVHSCAHSLSTHLDLHHGLANAIMLPYGIEFNGEEQRKKLKIIAQVMRVPDPSAESLVEEIFKMNTDIRLPTKLSAYDVKEADLEKLAQTAFEDVCHQCNPRTVSKEQFLEIYRKAL